MRSQQMMKKQKKEDRRKNSEIETEERNSLNTECDQDSEVSFMGDTDEDIDTAEIEEEDRIEYMTRSTRLVEEKMRAASVFSSIGNEDHFTPRRDGQKSSKMESRPQHWRQSKQSSGKTEKELGRRH